MSRSVGKLTLSLTEFVSEAKGLPHPSLGDMGIGEFLNWPTQHLLKEGNRLKKGSGAGL